MASSKKITMEVMAHETLHVARAHSADQHFHAILLAASANPFLVSQYQRGGSRDVEHRRGSRREYGFLRAKPLGQNLLTAMSPWP